MPPSRPALTALAAASLALGACTTVRTAPAPPPAAAPAAAAPTASAPAARPSAPAAARTTGPKPYREVITAEALTDTGLFTVHTVGEKLYFEVPDSLLGRDLLLVSRIAGAPENLSPFLNAGTSTNEQVVRFERQRQQLLLRTLSYSSVAADSLPIAASVRANTFEPVLRAFPIAAFAPDSAALVIDVTDLFGQDVPALSGLPQSLRTSAQVRRLDPARTYLETAKSFPKNVEVRHVLTYEAGNPPSQSQTGTISVEMNQSFVLLPKTPMQPRLSDPRVGYFSTEQIDFGRPERAAVTRSYIRRWRLEPKDPAAWARGELVEPVTPIVYYLDPATPTEYRPYFRQGIEDWNEAFAAAGFKNAIIARDAPTPAEDPEFSPEDARYNVVRYVASTTRNAVGPSVSDPRSGEIIESDIIWYHNHLRSYRNRFLIETAAANPDARTLDLPTPVIGEMMRRVIGHEIGHALGLPHNMGASSAYPVDSLRSVAFTRRMGLAPTIMDYTRQNYVAQPGDGPVRFVRQMGPYDTYAIRWGYRPIPGAATPDAERPTLDAWILAHAGDPVYRYGAQRGGLPIDPSAQTEDLGDDPVKATAYGYANLRRVLPNLTRWAVGTDGTDDDMGEVYRELVGIWAMYARHVVGLVGGSVETPKSASESGPVWVPVAAAKQREAVAFLGREVFATPTWLMDASILRRLEPAGALERLRAAQTGVLGALLDAGRMQRMVETEAIARIGGGSAPVYTLLDLHADVRASLFGDLAAGRATDAPRRALQRAYVERAAALLTQDGPRIPSSAPAAAITAVDVEASDLRPAMRAALVALQADLARARPSDAATRVHVADLRERVARALDPNG